jgi:hypothetical protein
MKAKIIGLVVAMATIVSVANAQESGMKARVTGTDNVSTMVFRPSPSSSLSCQVGEFPVYKDARLTEVDFRDLQKIIVRPDVPAKVDSTHISVELISRDGQSQVYEMSKYTRILGDTEEGSYSLKVGDLKSLEVLDE